MLVTVDHLILLDVYGAGETVIPGATGADLYKAIVRRDQVSVDYVPSVDDVAAKLNDIVRGGDFLLTQGAGETGKLAKHLTEIWQDARLAP